MVKSHQADFWVPILVSRGSKLGQEHENRRCVLSNGRVQERKDLQIKPRAQVGHVKSQNSKKQNEKEKFGMTKFRIRRADKHNRVVDWLLVLKTLRISHKFELTCSDKAWPTRVWMYLEEFRNNRLKKVCFKVLEWLWVWFRKKNVPTTSH